MKKPMFTPTAEIIHFSTQDILTASGESTEFGDPSDGGGGIVLPDDEL